MSAAEYLSLVSLIVTVIIGITGFGFTIYQINKSNKAKRAEYSAELLRNIRLNERIIEATYMIDYGQNWYDSTFHGGSENEKNIDALFSQLNFVCYLRKERLLTEKEFSVFKYELARVCYNHQCRAYLWNLYHWTNNQSSCTYLIDYLKTKLTGSELVHFESKKKTDYPQYVNFQP